MSRSEQPLAAPPSRSYQHDFMAMKACKHGTFLFNLNDRYVGRSLDIYGEWAEPELEILAQCLKPGGVVLDVGANIGTHTVFFAKHVTELGCVFAFEPQRLAFQILCANISLNALVNVNVLQQAVGKQAGTMLVPFYDPRQDQNFGGVSLLEINSGEPVPSIRIDDLHLRRCDLIKVDVEGMECDVLEGARATIARHRPVLFLENDMPEYTAAVIRTIDSFGYDAYWHLNPLFNPHNFFGNPTNEFPDSGAANLLCFHRSLHVDIQAMPKVIGEEDNWRLAKQRQDAIRARAIQVGVSQTT